ncbi:MAG: hypothetical protein ACXAC7_01810 [Candidatus Hodarchaeales archaeon]
MVKNSNDSSIEGERTQEVFESQDFFEPEKKFGLSKTTPNQEARKEIFDIYFIKMNAYYTSKDIDTFDELTQGSSVATIKSICNKAGLKSIRR